MPNINSATSFFPRAVEGFVTTLASTISGGATSLTLNSTAGYSVGDVVVMLIDPSTAVGNKQQAFTGIVAAGNIITNVVWTTGTNVTHTAGATVVDYTTSTGFDLVSTGVQKHANQDGSLKQAPVLTAIGTGGITDNYIGGVGTSKLANPYKFYVYRNATFNTVNGSIVVPYDTKVFDTGSNVDIVTNKGRFTAPVAGFYQFSAGISVNTGGSQTNAMNILKNGTLIVSGSAFTFSSGVAEFIVSTPPLQLAANDYIEAQVFSSSVAGTNSGSASTYFGGYLISTS